MSEPFHLRPAQPPMVQFVRDTPRCGLWAGMGIGKGSAVLFALELMRMLGELDDRYPTLVVGPARVARDTWPDELAKWNLFKDTTMIPLCGSPSERKDLLKRRAHIFTVSYELLPWLVERWLGKWPYRIVVADELDYLKGFREKKGSVVNSKSAKSGSSGKRAYAIGRIAHNFTDRWLNIGGTPAPNGLKDLWGSTWFLDRGERLGRTYGDFKNRWFRLRWSGSGIEPLPFAEAQIHAALRDICLTIDPHDYYDLKRPIPNIIKVKLPPRARQMYKKLEADMFLKLESGHRIDALTAAGLTNKCLQLANGALYTEYPAWEAIHDAKLEALESVVREASGMPILVAYQFKSDKARILKAFPGAVDISTATGLKTFRSGDSIMGIAHPGSMGHGIDGLQYVTNILVRFGRDWNLGKQMQMLERIGPMRQMQAGLDRAVFVHDIVAEGTIDVDVMAAHRAKRGVQDALLEAMKRR